MESKMKRKTIIYGMVDGVGPVGSAPQHPSDYIDPELEKQRDRVNNVAVFRTYTGGEEPNSLQGRVKKGDPSKT